MQEERGLIEQPLGRFDALHDDAARHGVQLGVLLRRQLAPGEHDDRNVGEARIVADLFQHLEPAHVRQPEIEDHAVAAAALQDAERLRAALGGDDVDVLVAEQLG